MLVDVSLLGSPDTVASRATRAEACGYDGVWCHETNNDPFLQALLLGAATSSATVGTSVAIALARTPMTVAYAGYDLARYAGGRFVLGLGSQVKAHIERRFSMPWSQPADRMRDFVHALHAIWDSWEHGTPLNHRSEFYTHTLMTPGFTPETHPHGRPPVYLAGVGERMTEVAGEVADGYFFHPFSTPAYLRHVTLPALEMGRATSGRNATPTVCGPVFVACAETEGEMAMAVAATKQQIAFYASTPAYRTVLDFHGMGELQPELTALSKAGRWVEMGSLIDDELFRLMAVAGTPAEVGVGLVARYGALADRVQLYALYRHDPTRWGELLRSAKVTGGSQA